MNPISKASTGALTAKISLLSTPLSNNNARPTDFRFMYFWSEIDQHGRIQNTFSGKINSPESIMSPLWDCLTARNSLRDSMTTRKSKTTKTEPCSSNDDIFKLVSSLSSYRHLIIILSLTLKNIYAESCTMTESIVIRKICNQFSVIEHMTNLTAKPSDKL